MSRPRTMTFSKTLIYPSQTQTFLMPHVIHFSTVLRNRFTMADQTEESTN
jgi:hypothetical protein